MGRFSIGRLKEKEVINLLDGTRLGYPCDFELNIADGKITAIHVPRPSGFLGLSHAKDLLIPWGRIECVGEDAILVRLSEGELTYLNTEQKKWSR